jgi:hypothetical protein
MGVSIAIAMAIARFPLMALARAPGKSCESGYEFVAPFLKFPASNSSAASKEM